MNVLQISKAKQDLIVDQIVLQVIDELSSQHQLECSSDVESFEGVNFLWCRTASFHIRLEYTWALIGYDGTFDYTYTILISNENTSESIKLCLKDREDRLSLNLLDILTERYGFRIGSAFFKYYNAKDHILDFSKSYDECL